MALMRQLVSPVLPQQPKSLILTPTEQLDTDNAMAQAKLNELSQARRLLAQAVDNAEQLAMMLGMHLGDGRLSLGSPGLQRRRLF